MKTAKFFMAFMATALLASCSDKEPDHSGDFGQIKVPDTRQLEQTVTADDTQAPQGVTFTTEGAWTSSIAETRSGAPAWITISPDHGDAAGSYTLKITLQPNDSEESRTAKIIIACGSSKIEITVTQEGSDEPGVDPTPKPESKWLITEVYQHMDDEQSGTTYLFGYDDQRRLTSARIEGKHLSGENIPYEEITITYPDSRKIRLTDNIDDFDYEIFLDAQGRAIRENFIRGGTIEGYNAYVYDQAGYCSEYRNYSADGKEIYPYAVYTWSGGNLTRFRALESDGSTPSPNFHDLTFEYGDIRNDPAIINIDLNALLQVYPYPAFDIGCSSVLAMIDALGPRSANLTNTDRTCDYDHMGGGDPEGTWIYYSEEVQQPVEWTLDSERRPTKATSLTVLTHYKKYLSTGKTEEVSRNEYKNTFEIRYAE